MANMSSSWVVVTNQNLSVDIFQVQIVHEIVSLVLVLVSSLLPPPAASCRLLTPPQPPGSQRTKDLDTHYSLVTSFPFIPTHIREDAC